MANSTKILILNLLASGLVCLILLSATQARAWEVVTGRVRSMLTVGDKIRLTVLLDEQSAETDSAGENRQSTTSETTIKTTQDTPTGNAVTFEVESKNLPPRLKEGDNIRIWSKPDSPRKPWRISTNRGHDPTGVRSRLHGRGRHSGKNSGRGGGKGGHGGH